MHTSKYIDFFAQYVNELNRDFTIKFQALGNDLINKLKMNGFIEDQIKI